MARMTNVAKDAYIDAIAAGSTITAAAGLAGHAPFSFRRLRDRDEKFQARVVEAQAKGSEIRADLVRAEIQRRGVDGVEEPVFYQGQVVGHIRRYSDTLLMAAANAHCAEYRAVYLRLDQSPPTKPEVTGLDLTQLTDEELDQFRTLAAKARPALAAVA